MLRSMILKGAVLAALASSVLAAAVAPPASSHSGLAKRVVRENEVDPELLERWNQLTKRQLRQPSADPFYNVTDADLAGKQPGDIIRSRTFNVNYFDSTQFNVKVNLPVKVKAAYQLLHVTQDKDGKPSHTVTSLLVPFNARMNPQVLVSFASAENSASRDCATSFRLTAGNNRADYDFAIELNYILRQLGQGYTVIMTDNEGPDAAFSVGLVAARSFLDGIRAARNFPAVVPNRDNVRLAFFGYSGGGQVIAWAVSQMTAYAPELVSKTAGAVYGGIPINSKNVFVLLNKGQAAGMAFAGFLGLANVYPDVEAYIQKTLSPEGKDMANKFRFNPGFCLIDAVNALAFKDVLAYSPGYTVDTYLANPALSAATKENTLNAFTQPAPPPFPVRIIQSTNDEIVPLADSDQYVKDFCSRGANVLYVRETFGEHQLLSLTGTPAALGWLDDRINGWPTAKGCQTQTVFTTFTGIQALAVFGQVIFQSILNIYNAPIGPVAVFGENKALKLSASDVTPTSVNGAPTTVTQTKPNWWDWFSKIFGKK